MTFQGNNPGQSSRNAAGTAAGGGVFGAVLVAGAVCLAMIAGMFFDWAVSIMPALAAADDRTYVVMMQNTIATINGNPLFLIAFMGVFVFGVWAFVAQRGLGAGAAAGWLAAALTFYLAAVVVTSVVHFPLNDTLANAGDPEAIGAGLAALRAETEGPWVTGHVVRTVATTVAVALYCRAMLLARRA